MDSLAIIDSITQAGINNMLDKGIITTAMSMLSEQIRTNQFLTGGLALGLLASFGYYFKTIPVNIWSRIKRLMTFSLYFDENDKFYMYFNRWLKVNHEAKLRDAQITLQEKRATSNSNDVTVAEAPPNESGASKEEVEKVKKPKYFLNPRNDFFVIWYRWYCPLWVNKGQDKIESISDLFNMMYNHYSISGFFSKKMTLKLIDEVMDYADKEKEKADLFEIYTIRYEEWRWASQKLGRPIKSVIMDPKDKKELISDLEVFTNSEKWYFDRGIQYKIGILFHGCPGSGKSSMIKAIATKFKLTVYYMNLSYSKLDDNMLATLFSGMNSGNPLLVIEDIDSVFDGRENISNSKISFSTLLNCLDGIMSPNGLITIITTNHKDKLDEALIRPGRVDIEVELSYPRFEQVKEYYELFFDVELKVDITVERDVSMAAVQKVCMKHRNDPKKAAQALSEELGGTNGKLILNPPAVAREVLAVPQHKAVGIGATS